jgi:predicted ABC-type ATPase
MLGLPPLRVLNPDLLTAELLKKAGFSTPWSAPEALKQAYFKEAAAQIMSDAKTAVQQREQICVETVLSTTKYLGLVDAVQEAGDRWALIYVALSSSELSWQRVCKRVSRGGHPVPRERIEPRWHRSIQNLGKFAGRADYLYVFDNSDAGDSGSPRSILALGQKRGNPPKMEVRQLDPSRIPEITQVLHPYTPRPPRS